MKIRLINLTESKIIQNSINQLDPNLFASLINSYHIYISFNPIWKSDNFPALFLISPRQHNFLKSLEKLDNLLSVGLYMGFIKKGNLMISIELLEFLFEKGFLSDLKAMWLNSKGEKSALYGNNIRKHMITNISGNFQKRELLLIFNQSNEIIALAASKFDSENINQCKPRDIVAINLIDKGYYLRKKQ